MWQVLLLIGEIPSICKIVIFYIVQNDVNGRTLSIEVPDTLWDLHGYLSSLCPVSLQRPDAVARISPNGFAEFNESCATFG